MIGLAHTCLLNPATKGLGHCAKDTSIERVLLASQAFWNDVLACIALGILHVVCDTQRHTILSMSLVSFRLRTHAIRMLSLSKGWCLIDWKWLARNQDSKAKRLNGADRCIDPHLICFLAERMDGCHRGN